MRSFLKSIFILLILPFFSAEAQQDSAKTVTSRIESKELEGILNLKATATNHSQAYKELNYLFVSIKKGASGNLSNNKQSGKFTLNPDETKTLSEINVNIQKNDALKVYLFIKEEETQKLISKDSLIINPGDFQQKTVQANEKQLFELKGLTIDETKTKIGKDFYDLFYLIYSQLPKKYNSAVTINELPTTGRGSQINIIMEDRTLYSFISNPNEDFLNEQAKYAMKILEDYNNKKALLKNEFRY